jgi:hypothetical protein
MISPSEVAVILFLFSLFIVLKRNALPNISGSLAKFPEGATDGTAQFREFGRAKNDQRYRANQDDFPHANFTKHFYPSCAAQPEKQLLTFSSTPLLHFLFT